ncbi:hypothetical protein KIF59_04375 [Enterobacter cloacae subsp. cloacae]|nr:hypothetical protein [Enterobacter cloacae subsp. cloacae]
MRPANIYIAFWLPQNIWVNLKVFIRRAPDAYLLHSVAGAYIYRATCRRMINTDESRPERAQQAFWSILSCQKS